MRSGRWPEGLLARHAVLRDCGPCGRVVAGLARAAALEVRALYAAPRRAGDVGRHDVEPSSSRVGCRLIFIFSALPESYIQS